MLLVQHNLQGLYREQLTKIDVKYSLIFCFLIEL
jgi:hypothetical protein